MVNDTIFSFLATVDMHQHSPRHIFFFFFFFVLSIFFKLAWFYVSVIFVFDGTFFAALHLCPHFSFVQVHIVNVIGEFLTSGNKGSITAQEIGCVERSTLLSSCCFR